ncbi:RND3 [Lepeophtheirus salmonis]|uniref:RND3 n=1 Tax=Lepeophtheirus salmonis TaxID=72036 RepID=A0A7R8CXP3_LEPSM|nr:RND3 [Lepeophtheirus salmonis]CAF2934452.1 RND3 [Lepeophtheirus salmonis]
MAGSQLSRYIPLVLNTLTFERSLLREPFERNIVQPVLTNVSSRKKSTSMKLCFSIWDTSGFPSYDAIRSLSYQEADVFLLCYKISDPASLYNVKNKWSAEVRRHRPDVPIILCGCHSELRHDSVTMAQLSKTGRSPVTIEQALAICCEIQAVNYIETSAKENSNDEAFEVCAIAAIKRIHTFQTEGSLSPSTHSNISLQMSSKGIIHPRSTEEDHENNNIQINPRILRGSIKSPTPSMYDRGSCNSSFSEDLTTRTRAHPVISESVDEEFIIPSVASSRPNSFCDPGNASRQRPTTLFNLPPDTISISSSESGTPNAARVRPNGLSQRTSYRSNRRKAAIPVPTPMSPLGGSLSSFDIKSPTESASFCQSPISSIGISSASSPPPPFGLREDFAHRRSCGSDTSSFTGSSSSKIIHGNLVQMEEEEAASIQKNC